MTGYGLRSSASRVALLSAIASVGASVLGGTSMPFTTYRMPPPVRSSFTIAPASYPKKRRIGMAQQKRAATKAANRNRNRRAHRG